MRITFISSSRWPSELADSRLLVKMAENFSKINHQVTFLIPRRRQTNSNLIRKSAWQYYSIKPRSFTLKKVPCLDWLGLYSIGLWRPLLIFSFLLNSLNCLSKRTTKIVYSYQKEFIFLKYFYPHAGFILEFHDRPSTTYEKFLFSLIKSKVSFWITPTQALAQFLTKSDINANKIIITPAGVDINKYNRFTKLQAREKLNLPIKSKIVGYVGHLKGKDGGRGLKDVITAIKHLPSQDIYFVCVGGSHEEIKKFVRQASFLGVSDRCLFIGEVNHNQVPLYLTSFDACLLPFPDSPHYKHFMSPMKMIEYMAAKRAIVTTDLPSVREVLDESSAIFVKPNHPVSLAKGITQALDSAKSKQLVKNSYQIAKTYTWEHRAKLVIDHLSL